MGNLIIKSVFKNKTIECLFGSNRELSLIDYYELEDPDFLKYAGADTATKLAHIKSQPRTTSLRKDLEQNLIEPKRAYKLNCEPSLDLVYKLLKDYSGLIVLEDLSGQWYMMSNGGWELVWDFVDSLKDELGAKTALEPCRIQAKADLEPSVANVKGYALASYLECSPESVLESQDLPVFEMQALASYIGCPLEDVIKPSMFKHKEGYYLVLDIAEVEREFNRRIKGEVAHIMDHLMEHIPKEAQPYFSFDYDRYEWSLRDKGLAGLVSVDGKEVQQTSANSMGFEQTFYIYKLMEG